MATEVLSVSPGSPAQEAIARAARALRDGGIVAVPTETVYGIAACLEHEGGMRRLRALKTRPREEPFAVQVEDAAGACRLLGAVPVRARPLMKHFWPGPLTIVFPEARVSAGGAGLGIRVPAHPVARALLHACGTALAVPSANPRGAEPAVDAAQVLRYFPAGIDIVLDGGPASIKEPSTVVECAGGGWRLLREGLISRDMIERLISGKAYLFVCEGNTCRSPMAVALATALATAHLGVSAEELAQLGFRFLSAGTHAGSGRQASIPACGVARELGLSLAEHRTHTVTRALIKEADIVLCMSRAELRYVADQYPEAEDKARLLAAPDEIDDPAGGNREAYRETAAAIRAALEKIWKPARGTRAG
ncbi:MAG TPA: threonylcarbamoyl-AMP synthase [Planctomycetes bacterium]|nr:threonylcarbamoyl-AMP synthase [Planctomycetota bacterium]